MQSAAFGLSKEELSFKIKTKNGTFAPVNKTATLKKYLIILLGCIILLPSLGSVFVYASFKLEQQEIVKTICVQRKMVFNTCNGRCELQKSLKKYNDNEKKMQDSLKGKTELVCILHTSDNTFALTAPIAVKADFPDRFDNKPISVSAENLRPPSLFI